jgi:tetratricopeptide (TPR) repeat protein
MARAVLLAMLVLVPAAAAAETPVEVAARLTARYHEDPTRIDRARELLEAALARARHVDTMIALARVCLLTGDVRATTVEAKLAAYDRGREVAARAVELAPRSEDAHFWLVANTGRWGQTKGVMRSLFLVPTVRREIDILLELNPDAARTHGVLANVLFELPALLGGDRAKAEEHFRKALELDPRYTLARVDLARLHIAAGRHAEARRELTRVLEEPSPRFVADWHVRDVPRARQLLESLGDRGR